jgi:methyl-accepting chemotaxis protein
MTKIIQGVTAKSLTSSLSDAALTGSDGQAKILNQLHSVAEFNLDAEFISVNANYLQLMGYAAQDLLGEKLSMLLDLKSQHGQEYMLLWQSLLRGETVSGQFKRMAKGAKAVWISASYIPVIGAAGSVLTVVEYATDVTEHVLLKQVLTETVQQVKAVLLAVQSGDLSQQVAVTAKHAELADMCADINALLASTTAIVTLVKRAGSFIAEAAGKVEAASKSLINSQRR